LVPDLVARDFDVIALDLAPVDERIHGLCRDTRQGSILDPALMRELVQRYRPERVYHLAAVLSAKAERDPELAHRVNVEGTLELFKLCRELPSDGEPAVRFLFPSSIAVYGLPDAATKATAGALRESEWTMPTGMYGCNKLYCEMVGQFLTRFAQGETAALDFRSIRFPGLISADTLPTSGTTDYAPAMIHAAARGEGYVCFVSEESRLPFMTMPDGVEALQQLADADASRLTTRVYNIRGFSASAGEIRDEALRHFPDADVQFDPIPDKQALVDGWPADVDDELARRDWGLNPRHDLRQALDAYLVPTLRELYTVER
jgi:nucleoside-diphosphate-sugar epimerase